MGFVISWLAARDLSPESLCKHLRLAVTDETDEANEAEFSVAQLPTGWTILWSNKPAYATIDLCAPLSRKADVVSCWVNEHVMLSSANIFRSGQYVGFVGHDGSEGLFSLSYEGDLPDEFEEIKDKGLKAQQERANSEQTDFLFDVPIDTAAQITGFRHDLIEYPWGSPEFRVAVPAKPTIIGRLFGKS